MEERPSILVVDDDRLVRRGLGLILEKKGYETETAGTGRQAMKKVREKSFNVTLLDIRLPDAEGLELIAPLKRACPDMAVVMITGYASVATAARALSEGAEAYITKPPDTDEIVATVERALEKQQLVTDKRRMEQAVQAAARQWRATIDAIGDALCLLGSGGEVLRCNKAMAELLEKPFSQIVGHTCSEVVHGTSEFVEGCPFVRMWQTHRKETLVLQLGERWVDVTCYPVVEEDGSLTAAVHIMADVTKRRRAEQALQRLVEETTHGRHLLLALSHAGRAVQRARTADDVYRTIGREVLALGFHAAILTPGDDCAHLVSRHLTFNSAMLQQAERSAGIPLKGLCLEIVPGGILDQVIREGQTTFSQPMVEPMAECLPEMARPLISQIATMLRLEQGIYSPLRVGDKPHGLLIVAGAGLTRTDVTAVNVFADQASIAIENARLLDEVTERTKDLQTLSTRLVEAQEAERRRISRELHDEMGQALTAIGINLAAIEQKLPQEAGTQVRERLAETDMLVNQTLGHVRELALDLRPAMLDDLGLVPALRWYVTSYAKRVGSEVRLETSDMERRLPMEIETVLYRIVQEALTNVARHAHANTVRISLAQKGSTVRVLIEDDGEGFDPRQLQRLQRVTRGTGLLGMRERLASLRGTLSVNSCRGMGTRLCVEVPIAGSE